MPPSSDNKKTSDGIRRRVTPPDASEHRDEAIRSSEEKRSFWDALKSVKDRADTKTSEESSPAPHKAEEVLLPPPKQELEEDITVVDPIPSARKPFPPDVPTHTYLPRRWIAGITAGIVTVIVLIILVSTVFARATLTITPTTEAASISAVVVTFDASVSKTLLSQRIIPAERLEFSQTETQNFSATGVKILEEKSRGTVKIYNQFGPAPQRLVATTRFLTDKGVLYRLPSAAMVPGAKIDPGKITPQFVEVELVADVSGEGSNSAGPVQLHIPGFQGTTKYDGFYAVAEAGFSGGFKGSTTVVSADDLNKAQEIVTKKIYDGLGQKIAQGIPQEFKGLNTLRQIEITRVDAPKANTRADNFTVNAEGVGRAMVFREEDVVSLLAPIILGNASSTKRLLTDSARLNYQVNALDLDKGVAGIALSGSATTEAILPEADIAEAVSGRRESEIRDILGAQQGVADFSVSLFPPWRTTAPKDTKKIIIKVNAHKLENH